MIPVSERTVRELDKVLKDRIGYLATVADSQQERVADVVARFLDAGLAGNRLLILNREVSKAKKTRRARNPQRHQIRWTPEMDARLRSGRAEGVPLRVLAAEFDISYETCRRRHMELEKEI